ncbi:MAG TPA: PD-(D/E)XK nuclease family protein, partial [Tepidisphaeraceae bacterium]|nr:PD-(D/E)XK nuclease family protein [Tepidisphaeraceae bacterium]
IAQSVAVASMLWRVCTPLGARIASGGTQVHRELSLLIREPPTAPDDPLADRRMIRGRIDALLDEPDGLTLVDYKTDRVTGGALRDRIELYRGQIHAYADAMRRITGRPIRSAVLAFLHARQLIDVLAEPARS